MDDDAALGRSFGRQARLWGFDVEVTDSPVEALELAAQRAFSVVVTDLRMPVLSGIELIEQLAIVQPQLSFILVTGVPDLDLRTLTAPSPAVVATLAKPWNQDQLREAIQRGIEIWEARRSTPQTAEADSPLRVLLVEDQPGDALATRAMLRRLGWEVQCVSRLRDAQSVLSTTSYDAVVCDLALPDGRGIDSVIQLRDAIGDAALVVLSGLDDELVARQAIRAGAHDFLLKGLDGHRLHRALLLALERGAYSRRLGRLARYDGLTGLANRVHLRDEVSRAHAKARTLEMHCGLLYIDLDRFKRINDSLGHDAGDALICEVADRLRTCVRDDDTIARLGGDEFAIVLSELDAPEAAHLVAERILRAMQAPVELSSATVVVTASIGVAIADRSAILSVDELLRRADRSMYEAKRSGRNRIGMPVSAREGEGSSRISLENELRDAVRAQTLGLSYQPQFDAQSGALVGYEALLRWTRADGTAVSPEVFVPVLEELGLIGEAGHWVLQQACQALSRWRRRGLDESVRMAVNVSGHQFESEHFVRDVEDALAAARLPPSSLDLEITETVLMRDTRATNRTLSDLRTLGTRIAIDDFGTGYSSLAYLQRFAVGALKIDRSFVAGMEDHASDSIAAAVIDIGHRLHIDVVAEGVETRSQQKQLQALGCDVIQGFLLGRPGQGWATAHARGA